MITKGKERGRTWNKADNSKSKRKKEGRNRKTKRRKKKVRNPSVDTLFEENNGKNFSRGLGDEGVQPRVPSQKIFLFSGGVLQFYP